MAIPAYKTLGIVLKRHNLSEADRQVTIYSVEHGKIKFIAKGVRRLTSRRLSALEPATEAEFFLRPNRQQSFQYLVQTHLLATHAQAYHNLTRLTQTLQILEIIDLLTVESDPNPAVYSLLSNTLTALEQNGHKKAFLLAQIRHILQALGFTYDKAFSELGLKRYVEVLAQKSLKTKPYLSLSNSK